MSIEQNFIKNIGKGIIIGIANIIPGVSGGTLAVSMGVYDKIISAITGVFRDIKKSIQILLPFAIGMCCGIVLLSFVIEWLYLQFPFQTNLLFSGLIIGCIPLVWEHLKSEPIKKSHLALCLVLAGIVIGSVMIGRSSGTDVVLSTDIISVIKLFFVGMIAAATMVIPGVSGSMMLTIMGYYFPILSLINRTLEAVVQWKWTVIWSNLIFLIPFGVGVMVGIIIIAKFMEYLLQKQEMLTYWGILGLVAASPVAIFLSCGLPDISVGDIVSGILSFFVGMILAKKLS